MANVTIQQLPPAPSIEATTVFEVQAENNGSSYKALYSQIIDDLSTRYAPLSSAVLPGGGDGQTLRWDATEARWSPTAALRIDNAGKVGISGDPATGLDVWGAGGNPSASADTGIFTVTCASSVQLAMGALAAAPFTAWLQVKQTVNSGSTFDLAINPLGGNVGVRTANPDTALHVKSPGAGGGIIIERGGPSQTSGLTWHNEVGTVSSAILNMGTEDGLVFQTAGPTSQMWLDDDGRLGIGVVPGTTGEFDGSDDLCIGNGAGNRGITISSDPTGFGAIAFLKPGVGATYGIIQADYANDYFNIQWASSPAGLLVNEFGAGVATPANANYTFRVNGSTEIVGDLVVTGNIITQSDVQAFVP